MPCVSVAQVLGTVAGNVKDASGAVLPGVTVEAASPALIEKVRTAVTDGSGQYRIVNLPPGTYTVTFTLPGFSTVKREAIEVSVNFTSTVDAELKVGSVEETITVTGESPIVDIQSATQTRTATAQAFKEIPSSGSWTSMAALMSAVRTSSTDVGGVLGDPTGATISAHGSRDQDARVVVRRHAHRQHVPELEHHQHESVAAACSTRWTFRCPGRVAETGTNGVHSQRHPAFGRQPVQRQRAGERLAAGDSRAATSPTG